MAARCESVQAWPFLRTGVAPREGQRLYMNVRWSCHEPFVHAMKHLSCSVALLW